MIGDKETSKEYERHFIKHLLEVAIAFKKLRISQIIIHPVQGGGLHRNLLFDGPDPFFPPQYKRKKVVWLRETKGWSGEIGTVTTEGNKFISK